eukprot:8852797-Pyramimonas_sp.AAC.1
MIRSPFEDVWSACGKMETVVNATVRAVSARSGQLPRRPGANGRTSRPSTAEASASGGCEQEAAAPRGKGRDGDGIPAPSDCHERG